jgi:hypothetical protein
MTTSPAPRKTRDFSERSEALAEFVRSAGSAGRLLPAEDGAGCPLFNALAALQWTSETGLFQPTDRLHAVWFLGETAATVIEREIDGKPVFRYLGPKVETLQLQPAAGARSIDEPFVKGFDFNERWSALAHFFVTTQGKGALASIDSARGVEVEHARRWLTELFQGPLPHGADHLHGVWTSTTGAGFLFAPASFADGRKREWVYVELGGHPDES